MQNLGDLNVSELNYDEIGVGMLAKMFRTVEEIADIFGEDHEDVEEDWGDFIRRNNALAKTEILKRQWEMARQGNIEMLKHLGVKYCGQTVQ